VATWDDVAAVCARLPGTAETTSREGSRQWRVADKLYAWERPLRRADLAELGDAAPTGPVLAVRVPDEGAKFALVADEPELYFTTAHFTGYPAVLCRLDRLDGDALRELVEEAWTCRAPRRLLGQRPPMTSP
jgi:hypothetical protein